MNKLDLSVRLRPIRIVYLVNTSDTKSLLRVFESNTCLWGGMFNPIIPFYKKTPIWWDNLAVRRENYKEIVKGYLNYFEPDFIVECEQGLGDYLGIPKEVTISLDDLIVNKSVEEESWNTYGLNAFDIYKSLYAEEYKYQRRSSEKFGIVVPKNKNHSLASACIFGTFPQNPKLNYLESAFKDVFAPEIISFDKDCLNSIYKADTISPLRITKAKCNVFYSARNEPTLYIFNINKPQDLIDFWNLRIINPEVFAIPVQFIDELKEFCRDYIIRNNIPLPGNNNGLMAYTTIQISRSISQKEFIDVYDEYFRVENRERAYLYSSCLPIWEKSPKYVWRPTRSVITSIEKKQEIPIEQKSPMFSFETLSPELTESIQNRFRWANVIEISDWSYTDQINTIYPSNIFMPSYPRISHEKEIRTNTEGLVIFPRFRGSKEFFTLSDGTSAMIQYLKSKNIEAEISDAGRTLQQMIVTIGGFCNLGTIANGDLITLLNKMAHKQVKSDDNPEFTVKEYLSRTVQFSKISKLLNDIAKGARFNNPSLESLISNNVLQLGLEVECENCGNRNWYLLNQLNYNLQCENCLTVYVFPSSNPTNRKINWAYRVLGPFSKPDYAHGSYSAALAIRVFKRAFGGSLDSNISWSTSLNLETSANQKWEIDFILWHQRRMVIQHNHEVEFIFGECKSYGKHCFTKKNIESMKRLANLFPGAYLLFAAMKETLSNEEKEMIASLALWGRESIGNGKNRANVIVFTSTELFTKSDLRATYIEKGGAFAKLVSPGYVELQDLERLSDITQQLHLGLDSYQEWIMKKYTKRGKNLLSLDEGK